MVKCSECGNPENSRWIDPARTTKLRAAFISECWSGDIYKYKPTHLFRWSKIVRVKKENTKRKFLNDSKTNS